MSPRPVLLRLVFPFTLVMLLIIIVCGTFMYWVGQRTVRLEQQREAETLADSLRQWGLAGEGELSAPLRQRLRGAAGLMGARISIIDETGEEIFDAWPDGSTGGHMPADLPRRPEVIEARQRRVGTAVEFDPQLRQRTVHVAVALPGRPGWILRLSQPESPSGRLAMPAWVALGAAAMLALMLVTLVAVHLRRQWVQPMRALAADAEQMASGLWHIRAQGRGAEDIRYFATRLNRVATQAEQQLNDLRQQRQDLQALVNTLPDPIIVTDAEQRITLLNVPASDLLELTPTQVLGKKLPGVVTEMAILRLYERIQRKAGREAGTAPPEAGIADQPPARLRADDEIPGEEPGAAREIRVMRDGQRLTFQAVARRTAGGGVLLVLRNVSTMSAAVQMKTDFVANASHELRTPIAAIKIAFETLREVHTEDPDQTGRCITIIEDHLKRLEEMLGDLLDLSRVESHELKPRLSAVPVEEIFSGLRAGLGPVARQKGVELEMHDLRPAGGQVISDPRLLNLLLKNLVENSIKFTPEGGRVMLTVGMGAGAGAEPSAEGASGAEASGAEASGAEASGAEASGAEASGAEASGAEAGGAPVMAPAGSLCIAVADTGIGIPPEHLDRVFERFYQADPARSGSAGRGTGLGLAIVKHAAAALGGTVHLQSRVGAGTTVTCIFPQPADEPAMDSSGAF